MVFLLREKARNKIETYEENAVLMTYLDDLNCRIRADRPLARRETIATLWGEGTEFVQVCFQSRGCRYSDMGACIMCDYGCGRNLEPYEIENYCSTAPVFEDSGVKEILIGTYGSSLDEYEMSETCFRKILERLRQTDIPMIGFETHCDTVSSGKLKEIKDYLFDKEIYIEMGFESLDDKVRERYLNKRLKIKNLEKAMELVHRFGFLVVLNILIGAPFLSPRQQIEDVCASVKWAFDNGADNVVLFPMNVKPYTVLYRIMQKGMYKPVSHWLVINTLDELAQILTDDQLAHVGLSWYGERSDIYKKPFLQMVTPRACDKCRGKIFRFYGMYQAEASGSRRRELIREILQTPVECDCREEEHWLEGMAVK